MYCIASAIARDSPFTPAVILGYTPRRSVFSIWFLVMGQSKQGKISPY